MCPASVRWCHRKRGTALQRRLLFAVGVVTALWLVDAALGVSGERRMQTVGTRVAQRAGRQPVASGELEVVQSLRRRGLEAVPSIVPYVIRPLWRHERRELGWWASALPMGGIANRPTVHLCDDEGWRPSFQSDEHGFMNPPGAWEGARAGIMLLGDSFTHGYCVHPDSNYAALLRTSHPSVLNLGAGGNGPLAELGTLAEYGPAVRPAVVVWQYYENDLDDLAAERGNEILARYTDRTYSQGLLARQSELDSAMVDWVERLYAQHRPVNPVSSFHWSGVPKLAHLRAWMRASHRRPSPLREPLAELPLLRQVLVSARDRAAEWGGRLVVVYVPSWRRYFADTPPADDLRRGAVIDLVQELGLSLVDLDPTIRRHPARADLFSRRELAWGHFATTGFALMALEVGRALDSLDAAWAGTGSGPACGMSPRSDCGVSATVLEKAGLAGVRRVTQAE
jgi:hypothetical protein